MAEEKRNEVVPEFAEEAKIAEEIGARLEGARRLRGTHRYVVGAIAFSWAIFQLYAANFGTLNATVMRSVHLMFGLSLAFLLYPFRKSGYTEERTPWHDWILAGIAGLAALYVTIFYEELVYRIGQPTKVDLVFGVLCVVFILEAARRVLGPWMPLISGWFVLYLFIGPYLPEAIAHRGYSFTRAIDHLYLTMEGIFGVALGASAGFIFMFIMFAAFLERTGIGQFFIDLANVIAGHSPGGPAKVAVITSAFEGTISGSSVANTVGSGSFTIPMMKKLGYRPEFAAAVEASASTGGQIMPPIMGAAAFLMAEFTQVPYIKIAAAAAIPASLYFAGVYMAVTLEAKRLGLKGLSRSELPPLSAVLRRAHLLVPLFAIIYFLVKGSTPVKAAFYGILTAVIASSLTKDTRMSPRKLIEALEAGGRGAIPIAVATASAGLIIGSVTLTGLGLKLGGTIVSLARGMVLPTLFMTMITSLILGMGIPTTANYVITSSIAAPAVIQLGVPRLAAHMFAFYFGVVADITPPVALAAYAGSGIAKSNPFMTGVTATKIAIAAFIVPYIFVLSPELLLIGATPLGVIRIVVTALLGMLGVAAAVQGYLITDVPIWQRAIFFVGGLLLIDPKVTTDILGIIFLLAGYLLQRRQATGERAAAAHR